MMKGVISRKLSNLLPSQTLAIDSKVKQLERNGVGIINLSLGEPDFITPKEVRDAAIEAINSGFTHYTETSGILELRQLITKKFLKDNKISYKPSEIVVGVGSKQLLYNALQAICNNGDEVVVILPTWGTYIEQIKLAGAIPVLVNLKFPFKLKANDIDGKISSKTKIIILNSPSNPTGVVIDKEELKKIAKIAVANNIIIISDEVYEKILYNGKHYSIASFGEKIKKLTITINSFSKSYAMTGWRIGYAGGPEQIIKAMVSLQSQTTSNTSSISQKAAILALSNGDDFIKNMLDEFRKRKDVVALGLSKIPDLQFDIPDGAFYFYVGIKNIQPLMIGAMVC